MHILTLTSLFPNSIEPLRGIFIRNRMENYTKKYGHKWSVIAPVIYFPRLPFATLEEYDLQARVPAFENVRGYPVYHPRYIVTPKIGMRFYGKWISRGIMATALKLHKEHPIDLIDGHYVYPDGQAAVDLGKKLGVPVLLSARGTDLNLFPTFPAIRKNIKAILNQTDHLLCVCSELKTVGLELGMPEKKISVIGNGVDAAQFYFGDQAVARKALNLPMDKTIILSVGHMTERKGFHILIEAMAKLKAKANLHLVIVGDGKEKSSLKNLARELHVEAQIQFAGAIQNEALPNWYRAADFFALASSREGWPNVVCEAQATGLPVIATSVWGIPEIICDPALGMLVSERTGQAFALTLEKALKQTWDRLAIAQTGRERTWDSVSERLNILVNSLLLPK